MRFSHWNDVWYLIFYRVHSTFSLYRQRDALRAAGSDLPEAFVPAAYQNAKRIDRDTALFPRRGPPITPFRTLDHTFLSLLTTRTASHLAGCRAFS